MSAEAKTTTDHDLIRRWVEDRDGWPASVKGTGKQDPGVLRIGFREESTDALEPIDWDAFFEKFEDENLAFLYQDQTSDGNISRFFKLVARSR